MTKLWSLVATFNVLFILNQFVLSITNRSLIDVFNLSQNWSAAPIFVLSFGTIMTIISFSIMCSLIRSDAATFDRIPDLWIDINENERQIRKWKITILIITVVIPILIQFFFWVRFHIWHAWINDGTTTPPKVSLYKYVSPKYFFDWDAHRYGDISKLGEKGWEGISYLPFWQPLLMMILSLISLVLFGIILFKIFKK